MPTSHACNFFLAAQFLSAGASSRNLATVATIEHCNGRLGCVNPISGSPPQLKPNPSRVSFANVPEESFPHPGFSGACFRKFLMASHDSLPLCRSALKSNKEGRSILLLLHKDRRRMTMTTTTTLCKNAVYAVFLLLLLSANIPIPL